MHAYKYVCGHIRAANVINCDNNCKLKICTYPSQTFIPSNIDICIAILRMSVMDGAKAQRVLSF